MSDSTLSEKSKAAFHAARKILTEYQAAKAQSSGGPTAADKQKLKEAGTLFQSARDYALADVPYSKTGGTAERYGAAAALGELGLTHYLVGDVSSAKACYTKARAEFWELMELISSDKRFREQFAHATLLLGQTEYHLGNIGDAEALFAEADAIYTQLGKPDMVEHVKQNLTIVAKKAAEIDPTKWPQFWFTTAFLILCMVGVGVFGAFKETPHQLLSSDTHAFGKLSRSVLPHSLLGSGIPVIVFGLVWFIWQWRIWRYRLGLERQEGPQQVIGLYMVMIGTMGFVGFYLGDVLYHVFRNG